MLSGLEIKRQIELGNIVIEPFNEKQLNPNSYNIKLGKHLKIYKAAAYSNPDYIEMRLEELYGPLREEYFKICEEIKNGEGLKFDLYNKQQEILAEMEQIKNDNTKKLLLEIALDPKKDNEVSDIEIPEEGYILLPGILYLGTTEEYTETYGFIPNIDGRSTTGRLGIEIHRTAGFGDNGFKGKWTLEITVTHPVIVYTGMEIGQLYYETIDGDPSMKYEGKYQNQNDVQAAKVDKE